MENEGKKYSEQVTVRWYGYIVLILTILFFSGVFSSAEGPIKALDFTQYFWLIWLSWRDYGRCRNPCV